MTTEASAGLLESLSTVWVGGWQEHSAYAREVAGDVAHAWLAEHSIVAPLDGGAA
jgi:hypothetical protein